MAEASLLSVERACPRDLPLTEDGVALMDFNLFEQLAWTRCAVRALRTPTSATSHRHMLGKLKP